MNLGTAIKNKDALLFAEVAKLMSGNYDRYEKVYELSQKYIYKIINDIVQNHHTTEDLMQETYLQIYNKIDSLKEAKAFYVWAGRIATNLTLRYVQKYRKELLTEQNEDEDEGNSIFDNVVNDHEEFIPESVLNNTEQQRIIAEILDGLSTEQKLCVQYYYYEEMSVGDIANLMECSTGTIKSRLNYARKSLKEAVSKFEKDNNVKLYSLSSMPLFYLIFKSEVEALVFASAGAGVAASGAVAGCVVADEAAASSGIAGSASAVGEAAASGITGAVATSTGSAASAGFLSTVAGKIAIVVTTVCVGAGTAVTATEVSKQQMLEELGYVMTYEQALEETLGETGVYADAEMVSYDSIEQLLGEDTSLANVTELNADYVDAVNALAAQMVRYEQALAYSMTDEQYAYIDQLMANYLLEIEGYLQQGEQYAQLELLDESKTFKETYMPEVVMFIYEEAEIFGQIADIYSKAEVKVALAKYSAADVEVVLAQGYGIGDLIAGDLSEATLSELFNATQAIFALLEDMVDWSERVMADPNLSVYFTQY